VSVPRAPAHMGRARGRARGRACPSPYGSSAWASGTHDAARHGDAGTESTSEPPRGCRHATDAEMPLLLAALASRKEQVVIRRLRLGIHEMSVTHLIPLFMINSAYFGLGRLNFFIKLS
jgi:hypothetical protein